MAKPDAESSKRTFEFVDGTANKFWEVWVDGDDLTTHWGRIGTNGQSKTKSFALAQKAQAELDKLVAEKLTKRYRETTAAGTTPQRAADDDGDDEDAAGNVIAEFAQQLQRLQDPEVLAAAFDVALNEMFADRPDLRRAISDAEEVEKSRRIHVEQQMAAAAAGALPHPDSPKEIVDLVWAFVREYQRSGFHQDAAPETVPSGKKLMNMEPAELIQVLIACFRVHNAVIKKTDYDTLQDLRERLLRRSLPYSDANIEFLASQLLIDEYGLNKNILGAIERHVKNRPLTAHACRLLRTARDNVVEDYFTGKEKSRIDALVGDSQARIAIVPGEAWGDAAAADIDGMSAKQRAAWVQLIQHCVAATSGQPTNAWRAKATTLLEGISHRQFCECIQRWFPLLDKQRTGPVAGFAYDDPHTIVDANQDILRGLVWCCGLIPDSAIAKTVALAAVSAYKKIPQVGARAVRVGNACVGTLGAMSNLDAVGQLSYLKIKVKFGTAQRLIEKQMNEAAKRLNVPREDLEEMSVPAYGLEEVGRSRETFGDMTAELVVDSKGAELRWLKADGKLQKSIPAAVQKEFAEELKELKAAVKDIDKMLPAQRDRLDGLYLQQKSWPLAIWRERYLDHPLVGVLARRLIWQFRTGKKTVAGIFFNDAIVGGDDQALELTEATTVEPWHPLGRTTNEVQAWRNWLENHEISQPFKQAHREIYVLTDAERETATYSNRFAAHILRQAQYRALAQSRGWTVNFLGAWDAGNEGLATKKLPQWDLRAEFWVTSAGDVEPTDTGFPYVSTDQVRFYRLAGGNDPIPLADVAPMAFTEIMRDVDLFVGVASVGNDPNWHDGGRNDLHDEYWAQYASGELSATAQTRKAVLERLVPRLKIAARCQIDDRYLIVRGDIRTYKIHLGSGNILMLPNDQYLCIVPSRGATLGGDDIFLPFEGDHTLAIILSKAFLLADDTKIKDPTITRQIKGS